MNPRLVVAGCLLASCVAQQPETVDARFPAVAEFASPELRLERRGDVFARPLPQGLSALEAAEHELARTSIPSLELPARCAGSFVVRVAGVEVAVEEAGLQGPARVDGAFVTCGQPWRASHFHLREDGFEEWIETQTADEGPVASWTIRGADLRLRDDGAVALSSAGRLLALIRAPLALGPGGERFRAWLEVSGDRLALFTEGRGHVLVDPSWRTSVAAGSARWQHSATLLSNGRVLLVGGRAASGLQASVELYDPALGFQPASPLATARALHTATRLASGRVLVFGGDSSPTATAALTNSAEIYDPGSGAWTTLSTTSTLIPRARHTATLLEDGRVLIVGGQGNPDGGTTLASAIAFTENVATPATSSFTGAGSMSVARRSHTATLLPDGTVLIAGGANNTTIHQSLETYSPSSNGWTTVVGGSLSSPRTEHTATLLPSGQVFLAGGAADGTGTKLATSDLYTPSTRTVAPGPALSAARSQHAAALTPQGKVALIGGRASCFLNCASLVDPDGGTSTNLGPGSGNRSFATLTVLPNGNLLLAGGQDSSSVQGAVELLMPGTPSLTASALNTARVGHTATLLHTGQVLVAGGAGGIGNALLTAELYTPETGSWSATGPLGVARTRHTATLLNDGRVLVAGGEASATPLSSAELYHPLTGTWAPAPPMMTARSGHAAVLLRNGRVLVLGGTGFGGALQSAQLYDPVTNSWGAELSLTRPRANPVATFMRNDRVLVTGGVSSGAPTSTTELFTSTFDAGPAMEVPRDGHTATALPSGLVLIAGGEPDGGCELFDPASGMVTRVSPLSSVRFRHAAALKRDGTVLAAGGAALDGTRLSSLEGYEPLSTSGSAAGIWLNDSTLTLGVGASRLTATTLANGDVLLVGGETPAVLTEVRRYQVDALAPALQPVLTAVPGRVSPNTTFTLSGTQLTGFGEGSSGGTQSSPATVPIVEVDRIATATRSRPAIGAFTATSVTVDGGLPAGLYFVRVITAGVPSEPALLPVLPAIAITPTTVTVPPNGTASFSGSGSGGAGYLWAMVANPSGGTLDGGAYRAGAVGNRVDQVRVSDLFGNQATATVNVGAGVSISPDAGAPPRGTVVFSASGGSGTGYSWVLQSAPSGGRLDGGVYTAGVVGSVTDVLRVTDSLGNVATASVPVGPVVSISPPSPTVAPGAGQVFTAVGGSNTGFVWTLVANNSNASFDGGAGGYRAGPTGGVQDRLRVTDSLGNTAEALISVGAALSPMPSAATVAPRQGLSLTAAGGQAPYVWSLLVDQSGASITTDGGVGVYRAGATGNRVDTVRVRDAVGTTGDVSITVGPGVGVTPAAIAVPPRAPVLFTARGGSDAGFRWTIASSTTGMVDGGAYEASATPLVTEVVRATDSLGNFGEAVVTVTDGVSLSPTSATVAPGGTTTFTAQGGSDAGFVFSFVSNASDGGIGATTGTYRAGPTGNRVDVVQVQDSLGNSAQATVQVTASLTVSPPSASTPPLDSITFTAMGGAGPPYTFSMQAAPSGGSVTAAGVYTAGMSEATDVLHVTDSNGNVATVTISVTNALAVTPNVVDLAPRQGQRFTATGGSFTGYVFSFAANDSGASLDGGDYVAGATPNVTDTLLVTDSLGAVARAVVNVGPGVSVTPQTVTLPPRGTQRFSSSGGSNSGFTWAFATNASGGTVTATGDYQAGRDGGVVDVLQATDSLGNVGVATVTVTAGVRVTPTNAVVPPREQATFSAAGGTNTGFTWSLATNASGGRIDPFTGDYTAGPLAAVTDVIRATDSLGNVGLVDVTVGPGITISPAMPMVSPGEQVSFTAVGGTNTGYRWALRTNISNGRIDPQSGTYTAGPGAGVTDVVEVIDSRGNEATVDVRVGSALAIDPMTVNVPPRGSRAFTAANGIGALTWALTTNGSGGSLDGGSYVAGPTPNVIDLVSVSDETGTTRTATVQVTSGVTVTAPSETVAPGGSMTFVASGGSGEGFTWTVASATGGTVDDQGNYVAGSAGDDVVTATDSLGNSGSVSVRVSGQPNFSRFPPVSGWSCGCQAASLDGVLLAGLAFLLKGPRRRRAKRAGAASRLGPVLVLALVLSASLAQAAAKKSKGGKKPTPAPTKPAPAPAPVAPEPPPATPPASATPPPGEPPPAPAPTPAPAPARASKPSLAVMDVEVTVPGETLDAAAFGDLLVTAADGVDRFRVISSKDIRTVLGLERQRQLLGCSEDSSCMAEIASALGADFVLVASVGKVAENYLVSTRLMDARASRAVGRGSAQVTEPNALLSALWTAAEQTFDAWGTTLPPDEAARWAARERPAPPATVSAPARGLSFGATVGAVGGWQVLSVPGQRGSVGLQVDVTLRVSRFDLGAGLIIGPNLGARLTATFAFLARRFRAMAGLRGTTYPGLTLFGGGPVLSAEFAFTPWLAASAVGGADLFPTRSGLVAVLLGNVGVAMHF